MDDKEKLDLLITKIKERIKTDEELLKDASKDHRMYLRARIIFCRRLLFLIGEEEKI